MVIWVCETSRDIDLRSDDGHRYMYVCCMYTEFNSTYRIAPSDRMGRAKTPNLHNLCWKDFQVSAGNH